eukprot:CAMPEP_0185392090 /NCGR_PEP_ID=MMETSP1364-20130426/75712_1 /TAXON_ID=38817 /ORGANISM="Gephyrocapsa oceanica, Strain RCC1303" /LENGTH=87 /DNA_ID=CAMNT_0027994119 /DNA_START=1 /DNA_END=260 /DNA_ORIENTATION=+
MALACACLLVCLGLCVRSRMVRAAVVRPRLHEAVLAAICKLRETDEGLYTQMAAEENVTRAKELANASEDLEAQLATVPYLEAELAG